MRLIKDNILALFYNSESFYLCYDPLSKSSLSSQGFLAYGFFTLDMILLTDKVLLVMSRRGLQTIGYEDATLRTEVWSRFEWGLINFVHI